MAEFDCSPAGVEVREDLRAAQRLVWEHVRSPGTSWTGTQRVAIAAFNVVDRIADATGIPLDPMLEGMSAEIRRKLDLGRFASSANTPGAS
jgi:hypothetical protein